MDYSKYRYEQEQRAKQARKHQLQIQVKEIKLRPKIGTHDYETKKGHIVRFLNQRGRGKARILFGGEEPPHRDGGPALRRRFAESVRRFGRLTRRPSATAA